MPRLPSMPSNVVFADLARRFPPHTAPLFAYVEDLMRGPGALDIADRELIAAYVSGLNACTYCFGSHKIFAEAFGIDAGLIEAMLSDLDTAPLTSAQRALYRYLGKLNTMPTRVGQVDMDAAIAAGVSEPQMVEAVMVASLFNMMNRLMDGLGVDLDFLQTPDRHPVASLGDRPRDHHFVAPR